LCPTKACNDDRGGFTLVELIVVIVILGILAAIAIPALTGYISKAEDKEYEMQARDASVAIKTVLNDAYASGEIKNELVLAFGKEDLNPMVLFTSGELFDVDVNLKFFDLYRLSTAVNESEIGSYDFFRRAATLMGESYPADTDVGSERCWEYHPIDEADSDVTAASAGGFIYALYPQGNSGGNPMIVVTYKFKTIEGPLVTASDLMLELLVGDEPAYDLNAGYEVYHLVVDE
jgi:prepilin-type N-terminal cleavage/methylation domain-containing protein